MQREGDPEREGILAVLNVVEGPELGVLNVVVEDLGLEVLSVVAGDAVLHLVDLQATVLTMIIAEGVHG